MIRKTGKICHNSREEGVFVAYSYMIGEYHAHGLARLVNAHLLEVGDWVQFRLNSGCYEPVCEFEPSEADLSRYKSVWRLKIITVSHPFSSTKKTSAAQKPRLIINFK